jgi:hypothetical protein
LPFQGSNTGSNPVGDTKPFNLTPTNPLKNATNRRAPFKWVAPRFFFSLSPYFDSYRLHADDVLTYLDSYSTEAQRPDNSGANSREVEWQ